MILQSFLFIFDYVIFNGQYSVTHECVSSVGFFSFTYNLDSGAWGWEFIFRYYGYNLQRLGTLCGEWSVLLLFIILNIEILCFLLLNIEIQMKSNITKHKAFMFQHFLFDYETYQYRLHSKKCHHGMMHVLFN